MEEGSFLFAWLQTHIVWLLSLDGFYNSRGILISLLRLQQCHCEELGPSTHAESPQAKSSATRSLMLDVFDSGKSMQYSK